MLDPAAPVKTCNDNCINFGSIGSELHSSISSSPSSVWTCKQKLVSFCIYDRGGGGGGGGGGGVGVGGEGNTCYCTKNRYPLIFLIVIVLRFLEFCDDNMGVLGLGNRTNWFWISR